MLAGVRVLPRLSQKPLDQFLKKNQSSRGCIMYPVIGDGILKEIPSQQFSPFSLLLFINLWSSLHIINIWWKCCFPWYERFNDLKKINPNLKILLAVGGWNLASAPFTEMVATAESSGLRWPFCDLPQVQLVWSQEHNFNCSLKKKKE